MYDNKTKCHEYYLAHKKENQDRNRKYYLAHKEHLDRKAKILSMTCYKLYRDEELYKRRIYRQGLKLKCFIGYSQDPPSCACCKESHFEFLSLDHINGGGNKHRRELGSNSVYDLYRYLIKNNFPPGFQILCHNCNLAKGFYGYCPHKSKG
jgi:hypothetical protein